MSARPSTVREALLAEVLDECQQVLLRMEEANANARSMTLALTQASEDYRDQINAMVERLRTETAHIVLKTTEHAASSLVGQQQSTLQKAAQLAIEQSMQQALGKTLLRRSRRDWLLAAATGAAGATLVALLLLLAYAGWTGH